MHIDIHIFCFVTSNNNNNNNNNVLCSREIIIIAFRTVTKGLFK